MFEKDGCYCIFFGPGNHPTSTLQAARYVEPVKGIFTSGNLVYYCDRGVNFATSKRASAATSFTYGDRGVNAIINI